jgi:hypothetical protein
MRGAIRESFHRPAVEPASTVARTLNSAGLRCAIGTYLRREAEGQPVERRKRAKEQSGCDDQDE